MRESVAFYQRHPQIEERIVADLRSDALRKKHERDRKWNDELLKTMPLEGFDGSDVVACSLELGTGRPRMDPMVVFVLLMVRGRSGGPCRQSVRDLLLESRSLEAALFPYMEKLPGETTILENLNALNDETLELIHRLQMEEARQEGLDRFDRIAIDSTAVEAASSWPTDSKTLPDLCRRCLSTQRDLESFGWKRPSSQKCETWLGELDRLHRGISMSGTGKNAQGKRRARYRDFFLVGCK